MGRLARQLSPRRWAFSSVSNAGKQLRLTASVTRGHIDQLASARVRYADWLWWSCTIQARRGEQPRRRLQIHAGRRERWAAAFQIHVRNSPEGGVVLLEKQYCHILSKSRPWSLSCMVRSLPVFRRRKYLHPVPQFHLSISTPQQAVQLHTKTNTTIVTKLHSLLLHQHEAPKHYHRRHVRRGRHRCPLLGLEG